MTHSFRPASATGGSLPEAVQPVWTGLSNPYVRWTKRTGCAGPAGAVGEPNTAFCDVSIRCRVADAPPDQSPNASNCCRARSLASGPEQVLTTNPCNARRAAAAARPREVGEQGQMTTTNEHCFRRSACITAVHGSAPRALPRLGSRVRIPSSAPGKRQQRPQPGRCCASGEGARPRVSGSALRVTAGRTRSHRCRAGRSRPRRSSCGTRRHCSTTVRRWPRRGRARRCSNRCRAHRWRRSDSIG